MARSSLTNKGAFRTVTLWLIWGWLLIFALLPNILVIAVSFLTRDTSDFISLPVTIESYLRLLDPLYFEDLVGSGQLLIVGAEYDLQTGKVSFLEE